MGKLTSECGTETQVKELSAGWRDAREALDALLLQQVMSHKVFLMWFFKSQFPHKSVNLSFILVIIKDELTNLWEN